DALQHADVFRARHAAIGRSVRQLGRPVVAAANGARSACPTHAVPCRCRRMTLPSRVLCAPSLLNAHTTAACKQPSRGAQLAPPRVSDTFVRSSAVELRTRLIYDLSGRGPMMHIGLLPKRALKPGLRPFERYFENVG